MIKKKIKNTLSYILSLLAIAMISGCGSNNYEDLKKWMAEKTISEKGHIKALPEAKSFMPIPYSAKSDPFQDKPVIVLINENNKYAPNPDRRKEPLEMYPLDNLKMTGFLIKDKIMNAMILAPDGTINYVTKNNYMGTNYGKIIEINEGYIVLDERVRNSADEWEVKKTTISLEETVKK